MELVKINDYADYKLKSLVNKLHHIKYFGSKDLALKYVKRIYNFIYTIPTQQKKLTKNKKLGSHYCTYKPNKQTTYFITFDIEGDLFLIKNVFNNHTIEYPRYIEGIK